MSDTPTYILREAHGLNKGLKELLKTKEITDRDIDIQRKNLRRQYLRLLLLHPYANESKDIENQLWLQTSYSLISIYKTKILALDVIIYRNAHSQQLNQPQPGHPLPQVQYRKLLQRFRQFLSDEEKFWVQLILRLRRNFSIDEAQPALTALNIAAEEDGGQAPPASEPNTPRRNQYQFPPESDLENPTFLPKSRSQKNSRIAVMSKALVCLGDIARYKELFSESGGRPRAGHEDGPPATVQGGRGRGRGGPSVPALLGIARLRNYERAQMCYEQARLLAPTDGNSSHQLAILASYQKELFTSLSHYYRALCVENRPQHAAENMTLVLQKALASWRSNGRAKEREREQAAAMPGAQLPIPMVRVDAFKEKVICVHAMWRVGEDDWEQIGDKVIKEFKDLVSEKIVPIDMISKVVTLSQAALWDYKVSRPRHRKNPSLPRILSIESQIVTHILRLHKVLLVIGYDQLIEAPEEDAVNQDLAQQITATFRRTLPALRMAGKWVRANVGYIAKSSPKDGNGSDEWEKRKILVIEDLPEFWSAYTKFANALQKKFPSEQLPPLVAPLEEDIEMLGFKPLQKHMLGDLRAPALTPVDGQDGTAKPSSRAKARQATHVDQVHPNEEQLMRIADVLVDMRAVAADEHSPIVLQESDFILQSIDEEESLQFDQSQQAPASPPTPQPPPAPLDVSSLEQHNKYVEQTPEAEEDTRTEFSRTTDDPVGDAFRQVLDSNSDEDDEEDEIVWNPGVHLSPRGLTAFPAPSDLATPQHLSPIVTKLADLSPPRRIDPTSPFRALDKTRSPPASNLLTPTSGTTAQDLLNNVLGTQRPSPLTSHVRGASSPAAPFLFGSGGPSHSIWSSQADTNSPLNYVTPANTVDAGLGNISPHHSTTAQLHSASSIIGQSPWSQPLDQPQSSHSHIRGVSQSLYPAPSTMILQGNTAHHRVPSESSLLYRSQLAPNQVTNRSYDTWSPSLPAGDQQLMSSGSRIAPPLSTVFPDTIYAASPNGGLYQDDHDPFTVGGPYSTSNAYRGHQAPPFLQSSIWGQPG